MLSKTLAKCRVRLRFELVEMWIGIDTGKAFVEELDVFLSGTVDQATAGMVPFRMISKILQPLDTGGSSRLRYPDD